MSGPLPPVCVTRLNCAAQDDRSIIPKTIRTDRKSFGTIGKEDGKTAALREDFSVPLTDLQHFLLQVDDLDATRDWYVDVLGLEEGPHPDFGFPVRWLYLGGKDVLHLTKGGAASEQRRRYVGQQTEATEGTGAIDHVAFGATGLDAVIARLKDRGVAFTERRADLVSAYQLFLFDPNGVKVELNFPASEAAGRTTEVMGGTGR